MEGSLSIVDDRHDFYRITVTQPGAYWLELRNDPGDIMFPLLEVSDAASINLATSYYAVAGYIRVPLLVVSTPQEFIVHTSLGGGGGKYQLELGSGILHDLRGFVGIGGKPANPVSHAQVHVLPGSGGYTDYWTDDLGGYEDGYRAAESTTVTPVTDGYTFNPANKVVNLLNQDQVADFTPSAGSFTDSMEPNNSLGQADTNANLSLPYDSVASAKSLFIDPGADITDYYRLSPAAGQGVRVTVAAITATEANALSVELCDSTGSVVSTTGKTALGYETRLNTPADGGAYYLKVTVSPSGNHKLRYTLLANSYAPVALTFKTMFGATAVGGGHIELYDNTFSWHRSLTAAAGSGITAPFLAAAGEQLWAELIRYGFDIDRSTRAITMAGSALQINFAASSTASLDKNEPNDELLVGSIRGLPLNTPGTVDPVTDPSDFYFVNASQSRPLKVTLGLTGSETLSLKLYNDVGNVQWSGTAIGSTPLYLPVAIPGLMRLQIQAGLSPLAYSLQVQQVDGHKIRGFVTDGAAAIANSRVYCVEADRWADCQVTNGAYDLGFFPLGTYTVRCFAPGYDVPTDATTTVTATDALQDFTLTPAPNDSDEPDNTLATAFGLPTDGTLSSIRTVGIGADTVDFCKLTATAGQLIEVTVDRGAKWHPAPSIQLDDPSGARIAGGDFGTSQFAVVTVRAASAGTYYVQIGGGPAEYTLTAKLH